MLSLSSRTADAMKDRLAVIDGKLYWKKCELYRWCPSRIRAGRMDSVSKRRVVEFNGLFYFEDDIIELLTDYGSGGPE